MSLGGLIFTPIRIIVCQIFQRDLKRKNKLDQTSFDPQFLNTYGVLHNFSILSLFNLVGVVLTFLSTKLTNIKGYKWQFEYDYKNNATNSL